VKNQLLTEEFMARAKRHNIPGYIWHITHRCHNGNFFSSSQEIATGIFSGRIKPGGARDTSCWKSFLPITLIWGVKKVNIGPENSYLWNVKPE